MITKPEKIQLFHTCILNEFYPEVGISVANILDRLGIKVEVPRGQVCCGQPAFNAGFFKEAKRVAQYTLELLSKTTGSIIIPSGSCAHMIIHNYPLFFHGDDKYSDMAKSILIRCREFTQFIVDDLGITDLGAALNVDVVYHPSCHLSRGLGITEPPLKLLENVKGLKIRSFKNQDECCGFGGVFSIKYPEISCAMMNKKIENIESAGAEYITGGDLGCLMHLEGGLRRKNSGIKCRHIAQLLDKGLS